MSNLNPKFNTILSESTRHDNRLSPLARLIYSEILYLSKKHGFCNTPNRYFAALYDCTIRQISATFQQLSEFKYVTLVHNPKLSLKQCDEFGGFAPVRLIYPQVNLELVFSAKK